MLDVTDKNESRAPEGWVENDPGFYTPGEEYKKELADYAFTHGAAIEAELLRRAAEKQESSE